MWSKSVGGVVVALAVTACGSKTAARVDAGESGEVLASVGDHPITLAEVQKDLAAQPDFVRARLSSPERRREYVEQLVRNRLLLEEARRLKLQESPEVQVALERLMIQQLLNQDSAGEPTDAEAQAWYDEHVAEFIRPERVQVSVVEFGAQGKEAAPSRAEVDKAAAQLRRLSGSQRRDAFLSLVQTRSTNEGSRAIQGDVGPRTREELTQLFGAEAAQQAFALAAADDISPPVSTTRGFVIFRLTARQPEQVRDFASEKARIVARLSTEARSKKLESLTKSLREKASVTINDAALQKLSPPLSP